jgi:hypothetical protein
MLADRMPREIVLKYTGLTEAELEEKKNDWSSPVKIWRSI